MWGGVSNFSGFKPLATKRFGASWFVNFHSSPDKRNPPSDFICANVIGNVATRRNKSIANSLSFQLCCTHLFGSQKKALTTRPD